VINGLSSANANQPNADPKKLEEFSFLFVVPE
jgi:hypothetical protein